MEKTKDKKYQPVVYVSWEESERNWGTRPDGCSLHLKEEDFREFEKEYWNSMSDDVPDEYSRPADRPVTAYASKEFYEKIKNSRKGLRLWQNEEREAAKNKNLVYGSERSGWVSEGSENHEQ